MAQDVIESAIAQGVNPRTAALDIVGRVDRATGQRQGGFIGLTSQQASFVSEMREALSNPQGVGIARIETLPDGTSRPVKKFWIGGDGSLKSTYKLRDKRFDSVVRKAIAAGEPLSARDIDQISNRYKDRLLKFRGDNIARTESITALRAGRHEGFEQLVDSGNVRPDQITRVWDATGDSRTREDHAQMDGQEVVGFDAPFIAPDGSQMMFPGDTSLGAPGEQTINCFAPWTKVSSVGLRAAMRHDYRGELIELSAGGNVNLSVTPNHPILTSRGWVLAGEINKGDSLFHCSFGQSKLTSSDKNAMEASAEELYNLAQVSAAAVRVSRVIVNFHGHVPDQDVDIVALPRSLGNGGVSSAFDKAAQLIFTFPDVAQGRFLALRMNFASRLSFAKQANGLMRRMGTLFALLGRHQRSAKFVSFANVGRSKPQVEKALVDRCSANADFTRYAKNGQPEVKQPFNFWKILLSNFGVPFSYFASNSFALVSGDVDSKVHKTGTHNGISKAKNFGGSGNAFVNLKSFLNFGKKGNTLPRPMISRVVVDDVRRVHYEGPVYNFNSDTGILLSEGIVNHNCRCFERIRVRYI
jgi:hypothetical protein